MQYRGNTRNMFITLLILTIILCVPLARNASAQFPLSDFYVKVRVDMNKDAIAFYSINMTLGPRSLNALNEANWTLKIQLPKWASSNLVTSTDMPCSFLASGEKIRLCLEREEDYDYLIAKIPPVEGDILNLTAKIGFVQREDISENTVGFRLPIPTGFNIIPEYVNFTFLVEGRLVNYSQYLPYFEIIFKNNTAVGFWNIYIRETAVRSVTGRVALESFDKCVIKSLNREIKVTEQLQVLVTDRLRVRYLGERSSSEILKICIPNDISQRVKVKDVVGSIQTYRSTLENSSMSIVRVYARYSLNPGQEYEAIVEYDIPVKNVIEDVRGGLINIRLKDLANYSDIVGVYSLNVKVEGRGSWKVLMDSVTVSIGKDDVFNYSAINAMPDISVQPLDITFTAAQLEAGRSISIMLGLTTILILIVIDMFREKGIKPIEELREKKEVEALIERLAEALRERIDYESRLEEVRVKNALGRISSKEHKVIVEECERRVSGSEKKISKTIEQISIKNPKIGEEVKRSYAVFEEMDADLKKMVDNTIERFRGGRITRSVFENLAEKYLKENKRRREMAANDVYSALERLLS